MPRYKCVNKIDCSLFDEEVTIAKVRMVYNKEKDCTEPSVPIVCKVCGEPLEYIKEEGAITCHLNLYESKTPEQKREIIHKRSVDHFKKTDKGDLANYKKTIINNIKRQAEGRS